MGFHPEAPRAPHGYRRSSKHSTGPFSTAILTPCYVSFISLTLPMGVDALPLMTASVSAGSIEYCACVLSLHATGLSPDVILMRTYPMLSSVRKVSPTVKLPRQYSATGLPVPVALGLGLELMRPVSLFLASHPATALRGMPVISDSSEAE